MAMREPMIRVIAMPADTNPFGDIFGGWLMAQMDLAASNLAMRIAMAFLSPVHVGDEVSFYADLITIGRTSMKINVEAERRTRFQMTTIPVTKAVFTFVAIDEDRKPRPIGQDFAPE
jgi:acyl-CoA thioesterase YciA